MLASLESLPNRTKERSPSKANLHAYILADHVSIGAAVRARIGGNKCLATAEAYGTGQREQNGFNLAPRRRAVRDHSGL
jgi:hypothetical protein